MNGCKKLPALRTARIYMITRANTRNLSEMWRDAVNERIVGLGD